MDPIELDMQAAEDQKLAEQALYSSKWPLTPEQKKVLDACRPDNQGEADAKL